MIRSPFEQFEIIKIIGIRIGKWDISLTNSSVSMLMGLGMLIWIGKLISTEKGRLVPTRWQTLLEGSYKLVLEMVYESIGKKRGGEWIGIIWTIFMLILVSNLIGLVPYSYTATGQLIVTLTLGLGVWIGKLLLGIKRHGIKLLGILIPSGSPFGMIPFFIILELISFIIPAISLSVRLFANMMSGHVLLNVILGFSWLMMMSGGIWFIVHIIPLGILVLLIGLELAVAMIQAYVFTLLTCIYVGDMEKGGH